MKGWYTFQRIVLEQLRKKLSKKKMNLNLNLNTLGKNGLKKDHEQI